MDKQKRLAIIKTLPIIRIYGDMPVREAKCTKGCLAQLNAYVSAVYPKRIYLGFCRHAIYYWLPTESEYIHPDEVIRYYAQFAEMGRIQGDRNGQKRMGR